jgi:PKD repeat protein
VKPGAPDGQNGWYVKVPTVNLSSAEPHHPVIYYRWDDGNYTAYKSDLKAPAGEHSLGFYAVDEGGNRGPDGSIHIKLDTVAPVASIRGEPLEPRGLDGWFNESVFINFTVNETGNSTVYFRWDQNPYAAVPGPLEAPEGIHSLSYYAVDEAGNTGKVKNATFKVDTITPTTVLAILPEDAGKGWFHFHPKLNLSTEPQAFVQYTLDGGPLLKYMRNIEIGEGVHNLTYFASDQAGNWEERQSRLFRVDSLAPSIWLNLNMVNITTVQNVTVTAFGADQNGVADYLFDFGDGGVASWSNLSSATHGYALPGTYTITVRVRDNSGLMTIALPQSVNVRLPPKPPQKTPANIIAEFFAGIPAFAYYLLGIAIIAAMAGGVAGHFARKKRRAQLYIDVEKAEAERERRHTMEIHEDDPLGLPRSRPSADSMTAYHVGSTTSDSAYGKGGSQGPSAGLVDWTPEHPVVDDAPAVETIPVQPEEVVYETEVNAPVPIWAQGAKQKPAPAAKRPATESHASSTIHHPPRQNRPAQSHAQSERQPAAAGQPQAASASSHSQPSTALKAPQGDDEAIQNILKRIEQVKKK